MLNKSLLSRLPPEARGELRKLSMYGLIGLSTNLINYLLFVGMIWFGTAPLVASCICYVLGVVASYISNRRLTFASSADHRSDIPRFIAAYFVGLAVTVVSMSFLASLLGPELAQLLTIGLAALSIYASLRLLRFGS